MADQAKAINKCVTVIGMSVKGGALAEGFQAYTNVTFDYTGVSEEELQGLLSEGSSIRVKAQGQMRKWSQAKLLTIGVRGVAGLTQEIKDALADVKPHVFIVTDDFEKADTTGPRDPVSTANRQLTKMDADQKIAFLRENNFHEQADIEQAKLDALKDEEEQSEEN